MGGGGGVRKAWVVWTGSEATTQSKVEPSDGGEEQGSRKVVKTRWGSEGQERKWKIAPRTKLCPLWEH